MIWKSIFHLVDAEVPNFTTQEKASITDQVYERLDIVRRVNDEIDEYILNVKMEK